MSGTEPLQAGGLEIWLADLEQLEPALEAAEARAHLLSASEREWATPAPVDARRHRRLARCALRLVLARCGVAAARGAEMLVGEHGKPSFGEGAPAFNVSHNSGQALLAIAPRGPLGIDLENERQVQLGLARQGMIVAAGAALAGGAERGTVPFLVAWTRLEAFAKARGSGIGALLTDLGITAAGVRSLCESDTAAKSTALLAASGLRIVSLALSPGRYGAVAAPAALVVAMPVVRALTTDHCRV